MILSATKKPALAGFFVPALLVQYPGSQTPDAMRRAFQAWKLLSGDEGTAA
ncbi:hypothetical protein ALO45_102036 [Pseudomonas syringae pv. syringae]|nr:hypothetical protein ALO45_102036 [Pseudomonas syringae pv. syringae]